MTHAIPIDRRGRTAYAAAYAGLVVLTGVAAVLLVPHNIQAGRGMWFDAQDDAQVVASWCGPALLAITSGSTIGQACALPAGAFASRWTAHRTIWTGLLAAILAGAGLAAADLAMAWWTAVPRLSDLAASPDLTRADGTRIVDPVLLHHGVVPACLAVTLTGFLIAAGVGFFAARSNTRQNRPILAVVLCAALTPVFHYVAPMVLVPWPR